MTPVRRPSGTGSLARRRETYQRTTVNPVVEMLMTDSTAPAGRHTRRREETSQKIMDSVGRLVRERGLSGITMEAVSEDSGVAKTTLYRRYADRYALLEAYAERTTPMETFDEFGTDRAGFTQLVDAFRVGFQRQVGAAVVGQLACGDEELTTQWRQRLVEPRLARLQTYFERGVAAGDLREDADFRVVVELVLGGAVFAEVQRGSLPDGWTERVVAQLWPGISATPGG